MDFPKLPRVKVDDENMEKMHCGARKGQLEEVQRLVEQGIDPSIMNKFGCTALHLACKFGQVDVVKYLAKMCDVHNGWHGHKPLHLAVLSNKRELVEGLVEGAKERGRNVDMLLNECDDYSVSEIGGHQKHSDGQTALHWCVALGEEYLPMLQYLVSLGASPTTKNKESETPIMYAVWFSNDAAMDAMIEGTKVPLRLECLDKHAMSHLHHALLHNREDTAMRFIELGHELEMTDENQMTPLFLAFRGAMPIVLSHILQNVESFSIQQAPFHNGTSVMPERIDWLPFATDEQRRAECVAIFQKRLDEVSFDPDAAEKRVKKQKPTVKKMKLAPSAPIRSRSIGGPVVARSRSIGGRVKK